MKSVLLSFYSTFRKYAVFAVLLVLLAPSAYAQQNNPLLANNSVASPSKPAETALTPPIDPSKYGTFIKDEKGKELLSYISKKGTVLSVGDKIMLTVGGRMDGKFFNIRYTAINGHNPLNADSEHLGNENANATFVITKIQNVRNGLINPKAAYAYLKLPGLLQGYAEIEIEPALAQNEFQILK
jgi:hypothetical protein